MVMALCFLKTADQLPGLFEALLAMLMLFQAAGQIAIFIIAIRIVLML